MYTLMNLDNVTHTDELAELLSETPDGGLFGIRRARSPLRAEAVLVLHCFQNK